MDIFIKKQYKILFFYQGTFSGTNHIVEEELSKQFPCSKIHAVNINQLIKSNPLSIITNFLVMLRTYGLELLLRKRDIDDAFFGTQYLFHKIRKYSKKLHDKIKPDFSFQTQSIFDCSHPEVPHFIYTDHTYASCKEYPCYKQVIFAPVRYDWLIAQEKEIYHNASCVFTMSENVNNILTKIYDLPTHKKLCVKAGCNASEGPLAKIPITLERYQKKQILFVGRKWELKGGPELIEAFKKIKKDHKTAELVIIGCNPQINEPGVKVIGFLPLKSLIKYYSEASIFCMPSKIEAFGIVFLEAMAAGLPVIGLHLGAAPDFIINDKTGVLVPVNNIEKLTDAMDSLLSNPEKCALLGKQGRELVIQNYSWEKTFIAIQKRITVEIDNKNYKKKYQ